MKNAIAFILSVLVLFSLGACSGKTEKKQEWVCKSCGQTATGNYCSNCGAKRSEGTITTKLNIQSTIGEWFGQVESKYESSLGELLDVFLFVYSDGTWASVFNGNFEHGKWNSLADNGNVIALIGYLGDEEYDFGWTFGKYGDSFNYDFNSFEHYTAKMKKVDTKQFSKDDLIGEWFGTTESKSEYNYGETVDVYIAINSDGTWVSLYGGDREYGNWASISNSGGLFSLKCVLSDGDEHDWGWFFGQLNGKIVFGFNHFDHYDVVVERGNSEQ